ncbi:hypothetical protein GGS21DRAFT_460561 [Xylaria nigripes]|nr:hypothetical protein GGS21DRAFT_460561 [Xylaria nigripes]
MLPEPLVALKGSCSVVFDNKLYAYSASGFQSLELKEGAMWERLPGGVSVDRSVCVGSTPKNLSAAGLFIVGGESSDPDYPGLQKFTYSTGNWETITPGVPVTKNRVYHSAAYINSTESLLVYAGTTDGQPHFSQQTFTVHTSPPYTVLAFKSNISSPGVAPLLLPWSETQAALIGGNPWNTKITLFDTTATDSNGASGSWIDSGATLADPLPKNSTAVKGVIIQADDGSKHLYTFDLTTLPNTVNRTVLVGANGTPIMLATPVEPQLQTEEQAGNEEVAVKARDLEINNWPPYDSTNAPTFTSTDYSIATDPHGLVVISGGNMDQELCLFNARANSWENAEAVLGGGSISTQSVPTSASSGLPENSATNTANAPPVVPTPKKHVLAPGAVLGITLGSVFAVAALFAVILIVMKCRQRKQNHAEAGRTPSASGIPQEEVSPQGPAQMSTGYFGRHFHQGSQSSLSSIGIFLGKSTKPTQIKGSSERARPSGDSFQSRNIKQTISRPQPQTSTQPAFLTVCEKDPLPPPPAEQKPGLRQPRISYGMARRSSGWNKYWSGGSNSLIGICGRSRPETEFSDESSRYSDMNVNRLTQDSATVPPLHVLVEGRPSFQHVSSGSPTMSQYGPTISEGLSAQFERAASPESDGSYRFPSSIPPSIDTWETTMQKGSQSSARAPSSVYSTSSGIVTDGLRPPSIPTSVLKRGLSQQPQLTVASMSTDMSWLNLGDNRDKHYSGADKSHR